MAGSIFEKETILFTDENQSEFILTEIAIKQEPELIIEDEDPIEKIHEFVDKTDISEEDRMNLIWHSCAVCEERFVSIVDLSLHNEIHIKSEEIISTSIPDNSETNPKNDFKCSQLQINTDTKKKRYECDLCDKSYPRKEHLLRHIQTHSSQRGFICDLCDRSFNEKKHFLLHERTHTGERPSKCDICNNSFTRKEALAKHTKTHSSGRPFGF